MTKQILIVFTAKICKQCQQTASALEDFRAQTPWAIGPQIPGDAIGCNVA